MAETEDRSLQLHALIVSKGNEIRALKAAKITKAELKPHVVELLGLKDQYKSVTGTDWKPTETPSQTEASASSPAQVSCGSEEAAKPEAECMLEHSGLIGSILRKGEEIRKLQEEGIPQLDLQLHVDEWQNLKLQFQDMTGRQWVDHSRRVYSSTNEDGFEVPAHLQFARYSSIEPHTSAFVQNMLSKPEVRNMPWIALEKVHGANFGIYTDGSRIVPARRSSILRPTDVFYDYLAVIARYREPILRVFDVVNTRFGNMVQAIRIYGELYGGFYPGMPKVPGSKLPNKDIYYCPQNDLIAFDIQVIFKESEDAPDARRRLWLDQDIMVHECETADLPVLRALHEGTLPELLQLNPLFLTTIPERHGMPPLADNYAEGFVLKTKEHKYYHGERAILKFKNERFLEMHNRGYKASAESKEQREAKQRVSQARKEALDEGALEFVDEALAYVTRERLVNVWSKLLPLEQEDRSFVVQQLLQDAFKDFKAVLERTERYMNKNVRKRISNVMSMRAEERLHDYLEELGSVQDT